MKNPKNKITHGCTCVHRKVVKNKDGYSIFLIEDLNYLEGDKKRETLFLREVGSALCNLQNKITAMSDDAVNRRLSWYKPLTEKTYFDCFAYTKPNEPKK